MRKRRLTKLFSAFLAAAITFTTCDISGISGMSLSAEAATVSGEKITVANFGFESGLEGWEKTGTVTVENSGGQDGKYVKLAANSSITMTVENLKQGSYTLSAWVKGAKGNGTANITVSETGGPDSMALLDSYLSSTAWSQMGHRNVLIYNGQMTVTISTGSRGSLELDSLELTMDSEDTNSLANWDFEEGLASWKTTGTADVDTGNADTGEKAVRLASGSEISQTVKVEPNTRYSVTMRAKVDKQDAFKTIKVASDYRKDSAGNAAIMGELQERISLGDRVNLGVRTKGGTVLRQAPSGTEDYSLVSLTFTTGANDTEVEIYANTKYDQAYKDSVTVYTAKSYADDKKPELADSWQGNGTDNAYVDNFDLFQIQDENNIRGADVSYLPAIEDLGGKYFANGVQQDCLRILSNHGVNSIIGMIFVHAGKPARYWNDSKGGKTLGTVYLDEYKDWGSEVWTNADGSRAELKMIEGYFDKKHSVELGKRATELGMSYLPSFHYSDTWISAGKAFCPEEWLDIDYESESGYAYTDLAHMQSIVYNYVYDFVKTLADEKVNVIGIKHGNEQNSGLIFPIGSSYTSKEHAAIIAASYNAAEDAMPGISGYVHFNNGYLPEEHFGKADGTTIGSYNTLIKNGAKIDGAAFSLYGGRSSNNIVAMARRMLEAGETIKYMDYVNVETGFTFTSYSPTVDTAKSSMGQKDYYYANPNGQYNWLLDYMQAALDVPNPYGQTRGFYYWETDWIPTPGAGSTAGGSADINQRCMFNNGDPAIKEMGSKQDGKAGDMLESMYAYLMRGCSKEKSKDMQTPAGAGSYAYAVDVAEPTKITLSQSSEGITLAAGEKTRLKPTVEPIDKVFPDSNITYTSSNPSVAKVTHDGYVCGMGAGSATVTAEIGGYSATVNVTVKEAVQANQITLKVNEKEVSENAEITAIVLDKIQLTSELASSATNKTVIYTSSNPEVASFLGETWQTTKGEMRQETEKASTKVQLNVTGEGETTITAASADGGASVGFTLKATKTAAAKLKLDKENLEIAHKRTAVLTATLDPRPTLYKIHWESNNKKVVTVEQTEGETCKITAVGIGDAVIRAISDDNEEVYAECAVKVVPVPAESIKMDKSSLSLLEGTTKTLNAIFAPADTSDQSVIWKSEDTGIVYVNQKGEVTGISASEKPVKITAVSGANNKLAAECSVTVVEEEKPATEITLSDREYYFKSDYFSEINPDENAPVHDLTAALAPLDTTDTDIVWVSDTPEVAVVDELGRVTAVGEGVATISASVGGLAPVETKVYVPSVSESFENREVGTNWSDEVNAGATNKGAKLGNSVTEADRGKVLQVSTKNASGPRGWQKKLSPSIVNDKIVLDFDWNSGEMAAASNGSYITITDSENNRYLTIQTNKNTELKYSAGGQLKTWEEAGVKKGAESMTLPEDAPNVGTGFHENGTWYHLHVILDMKEEQTIFTITSLGDENITATHTVEFDAGTSYKKDLGAIQLVGTRPSNSNLTWESALDNVNIYKTAPTAKGITVNTDSIKLIPIAGALDAQYQLKAQITPASVTQDVVWESSDTKLVNVDSNGLVTSAVTYNSLDEIKTGTCTIRASSKENSSVYTEVAVEISNNPGASEFFSIKDEEGNVVFSMGDGASTVNLETGAIKRYIPVLTGGDGNTYYKTKEWSSSDPSVVAIDENGKVMALKAGEATVTLTVTLYTGDVLTGTIDFVVTGDAVTDVKAITINEISGRILENKKVQLTAEVMPENGRVFWSSDNLGVAIIDKNTGELYPVSAGTVKITASSEDGEIYDTKTITVNKKMGDGGDLTSYYEENGVTITAENTAANASKNSYSEYYPFSNAREKNYLGKNSNGVGITWAPVNKQAGTLQVDLGGMVDVENVATCFWSQMTYKLSISDDGENWQDVEGANHWETKAGGVSTASTWDEAIYTDEINAKARYVRLSVKEGNSYPAVTSMQINGAYTLGTDTLISHITCEPCVADANNGLTIEALAGKLPKQASARLSAGGEQNYEITWDEKSLKKVANANAAGTYDVTGTVMAEGIAYNVTCKVTLDMDLIPLEGATVTLEKESYPYTGTPIKPVVTEVKLKDGTVLTEKDYKVRYTKNLNVGTATVKVTGSGRYTGTVTKNFIINTLLDATITEAEALKEEDYTVSSWSVLQEALQAAKNLPDDAAQEEMDAATEALQAAIKNLLLVASQTLEGAIAELGNAVNNAKKEIGNLNESDYTPESWSLLQEALKAAESLLNDKNAKKEAVIEAERQLNHALKNLKSAEENSGVTGIDRKALQAAITKAKTLKESDYTAKSWEELQKALQAAENLSDKASQSEVDAAAKALQAAIANLVPVEEQTLEEAIGELSNAINSVKNVIGSLNESDYTPESWAALQKALKAAEDLLNDKNAKKEAVIEAERQLNHALRNLKSAEENPGITGTDRKALQAAITKAKALKESNYTAKSWKNLQDVLKAAESLSASASQIEVDAAVKALNDAMAALQPATSTSAKPKVKKVTAIQFSQKTYQIAAGKKVTLKPAIKPADATKRSLTWKSSNKKYATVNTKGVVTTKKAGIGKTVTITAKATDGSGKKATVKIKIMKHAVTKITLKVKTKTIKAGQKVTIRAIVKTNGKKANKKLEWKSSNEKYATVNAKGVVTTKKAGKGKTVTITAKATDGTNKQTKIKFKIKTGGNHG